MEHFRILLLALFISQNLLSQSEVDNYGNTVRFYSNSQVQYALHGSIDKEKKTVFFVDGSMATSRYLKHNDTVYFTAPQEILDLASEFNLVILGKPNIPLLLDYKFATEDGIYRDSTGSIPVDFILKDNMSFYLGAYNKIIDHVNEEFELKDIFIFGHSQGSRIAGELALHNEKIKGVVFSSVDPLGRIATLIDKNYANFEKQDKSEYLKSVIKDGTNSPDSSFMNSTHYAWRTFSYPLIVTLSNIETPILMVYGNRDVNCPNCYVYGYLDVYIPNLETLHYDGYDHNFKDKKGVRHWGEIIKDITDWIKSK